jgi:hypothetical protein
LEQNIDSLQSGQKTIETNMSSLQVGQKKILKELNNWTKFFDRDDTNMQKRIKKIESHLGFQMPNF